MSRIGRSFNQHASWLAIAMVLFAGVTLSGTPETEDRKQVAQRSEGGAEQRKQAAKQKPKPARGDKKLSAADAARDGVVSEPARESQVAAGDIERKAFYVCADPNNLPFSNRAEEGFENKIAQLMAKDLGLPVEYYWVPFQMGYDRLGLKGWNEKEDRFNCDIIMGTTSLEVGETTTPYYASTYTLVYPKGGKLGDLETAQDLVDKAEDNRALRIGAFDLGPGAAWLQVNGLLPQLAPYRAQSGSRAVTPARIVKDVVDGKIDAALVWGPIAGYYAHKYKNANLEVLPLKSDAGIPGLRFDYGIAMGIRYGEEDWMRTIEQLIADNNAQIQSILTEYHVPLVKIPKQDLLKEEDDD
jgi:quinoprotein dehydrogenase-associated probable ABC transporter substrate-binding protein